MGETKPLGSEKLNANEKLQRILDLTYYQKNTTNQTKKHELVETVNGVCYGVAKEKDGYYVKKGLNENSLDYIGGMFMKNKNRFRSYGDAFKRLEFLKGQDVISEATKYILKNNSVSQTESPAPQQPMPDMGVPEPDASAPAPDANAPAPDVDPSEELPTQVGNETDDSDPLKAIQKLSGKLGQKLREYNEDIESDDIKYVINMVLSAVDLEKLEDTDKDEIVSKIEGDDETESGFEGNSTEPSPEGEEQPINTPEDELGEVFSTLEDLTNTDFDFDDDDDDFDNDFDHEQNYIKNNLERQNYETEKHGERISLSHDKLIDGYRKHLENGGENEPYVYQDEEDQNDTSLEETDQEIDELMNYFSREKDVEEEEDELKWYGDEESIDEEDEFVDFGQYGHDDEYPDANDQRAAIDNELEDRFDDYGTTSNRTNRRQYSDELSLNEIRNLIKNKNKK